MFLDQLMLSEAPKYTWASLICNNMNCSHNKVPKMLAKKFIHHSIFFYMVPKGQMSHNVVVLP